MNTAMRFIGFPLLSILLLLVIACDSSATAPEATESPGVPTRSMTVTPSPPDVPANVLKLSDPMK